MKEIATCRKSRVRIATRVQKNTLKIHVIVRKSFDMETNRSQRVDYDSIIKVKKRVTRTEWWAGKSLGRHLAKKDSRDSRDRIQMINLAVVSQLSSGRRPKICNNRQKWEIRQVWKLNSIIYTRNYILEKSFNQRVIYRNYKFKVENPRNINMNKNKETTY